MTHREETKRDREIVMDNKTPLPGMQTHPVLKNPGVFQFRWGPQYPRPC